MQSSSTLILLAISAGLFCFVGTVNCQRAEGSAAENAASEVEDQSVADLLPDSRKLFNKESLDVESLEQIDCHLRNLDFCYAGLLGSMSNFLPETDQELQVRCDEYKVAMSCLAIYNKRCQSFKIFEALIPMIRNDQSIFINQQQQIVQLRDQLTANGVDINSLPSTQLMAAQNNSLVQSSPLGSLTKDLSAGNLNGFMSLCEPDERENSAAESGKLRARLFELAKCVNKRVNLLRPCIDDLKAALQIFYEPGRVLPLKPSCCAMSRFQYCARQALDGICGLNSFNQLESALMGNSGSSSQVFKVVERVCRQANKFDSPFCKELLPPSGLRAPQRRGSKASKLAKALDLVSFGAPVAT